MVNRDLSIYSVNAMKKIIVIFIIFGAVAAAYWHMSSKGGKPRGFPTPMVEVISASEQPLYDNVEVLGSSYANEWVEITANVSEVISEIKFSDGQFVNKGDVIAVLEQREEQAQLKAAQLQLKEHKRELKRLDRLVKSKAASKRNYDERLTMRNITRQQIEEIKARIADRTIYAPFDGNLGIRQLSVGSLLMPSDVITTIQDIRKIKLDFNVPSTHLMQLKVGTQIEARSDILNGTVFKGKIETINNRVDPVTRSILVRAVIDNPEKLIKPGILMEVKLLKNERQAVVVPEESAIQEGAEHYVLVVKADNRVEKRKIVVGVHREGVIEVVQGLEVGENIIVRGVHKVRPGQAIKVKEVWNSIRKPDTGGLEG